MVKQTNLSELADVTGQVIDAHVKTTAAVHAVAAEKLTLLVMSE
jgi:hypothetical protein